MWPARVRSSGSGILTSGNVHDFVPTSPLLMTRCQTLVCISSSGSHVTLSPSTCDCFTQIQAQLTPSLIPRERKFRMTLREGCVCNRDLYVLIGAEGVVGEHEVARRRNFGVILRAPWLNLRELMPNSTNKKTANSKINANGAMAFCARIHRFNLYLSITKW